MRGPRVRPRHDQIAELTRGVRLPLAPIADEHLEILAEGLGRAFDDIRAHAPATVAMGEEPEVTALMQARLIRLIYEDTLWRLSLPFIPSCLPTTARLSGTDIILSQWIL